MGQREIYLDMGFEYRVKAVLIKGKAYTDFTVFYHDLDIYNSKISHRINADSLFIKVCDDFIQNSWK